MDVILKIWKSEHIYGFYRGLIPNVLRVTPAAAITFTVYEKVIILLT